MGVVVLDCARNQRWRIFYATDVLFFLPMVVFFYFVGALMCLRHVVVVVLILVCILRDRRLLLVPVVHAVLLFHVPGLVILVVLVFVPVPQQSVCRCLVSALSFLFPCFVSFSFLLVF